MSVNNNRTKIYLFLFCHNFFSHPKLIFINFFNVFLLPFAKFKIKISQLQKQSFMRTYQTSENISDVHLVDFKNYIQFANKDILLIDHLGIYKNIGVKNPIIVLQHSPKINLQRLINTVHPSKIIADGSNYKREVLRWENSCLKNNIPFYNTAKKGDFILRE